MKFMKKNKAEEPQETNAPVIEETLEEEGEEETAVSDLFYIKTGGHFDEKDILEIELPKFLLKNSVKGVHEIDEKSTINVSLRHDKTNPNIGKRIFKAIKDGLHQFEIHFPDENKQIQSIWKFYGVKIRAADFGNLSLAREQPRAIQCELEYDYLSIDNEIIS